MPENPDKPARILVVDDDPGQRSLLESFLRGQGFDILTVDSGEKALSALRESPFDLMISDVRMPGISGLETLRRARREHASLPVLLVTAYADVRDAVGAIRDGALNYLGKPMDLDELLASVRQATGLSKPAPIRFESKRLPDSVIARSPLMQAVFRDASLIADSQSRVLITGESGVGKEVLADVIHAWSPRRAGPLVKVNCAAIQETLLESELFGHEKGAFSGAVALRRGRFEQANNGTIFLDEIAEMSPQLQAKLLHVTQDGRFQRVGSNTEIHADARILTATNRNLEEEVKKGRFREDLYYRLNVVELNIPSLRERPEDIAPLASHFVVQFAQGRARLAPATLDILQQYAWPGNVRELRNVIERMIITVHHKVLQPADLPEPIHQAAATQAEFRVRPGMMIDAVEKELISQTLLHVSANRELAARALGISRRTLQYKLKKYGLLSSPEDPRNAS